MVKTNKADEIVCDYCGVSLSNCEGGFMHTNNYGEIICESEECVYRNLTDNSSHTYDLSDEDTYEGY